MEHFLLTLHLLMLGEPMANMHCKSITPIDSKWQMRLVEYVSKTLHVAKFGLPSLTWAESDKTVGRPHCAMNETISGVGFRTAVQYLGHARRCPGLDTMANVR